MAKFIHNKQQEIEISPCELSELFWAMNDLEQALFFNHLGILCDDSHKRQLQFLSIMEETTREARDVMTDICLLYTSPSPRD